MTPEQEQREREAFERHIKALYAPMQVKESLARGEFAQDWRLWLARAAIAHEREMQWRPIESVPKGKHVLVHYKNQQGKSRLAHAVYIERFTEEACWESEDCGEYCEEKDEYYTPEGWYEICQNWDNFSSMKIYEGEPDAWMPLPASPAQNAAQRGES